MKRLFERIVCISISILILLQAASVIFISAFAVTSNEAIIYNFLIEEMGLNIAAATGVLANIEKESGFRNNVIEAGYTWESGGGYGICQWTNYPRTASTGRRTNLVNWCNQNGYDYSSLEGQLHFLQYEMNTSQLATYNYLKTQPNSSEGSYESARYFCVNFEKPANTTSVSQNRGNLARDTYWPKYSVQITASNKLNSYNPNAAAAYAERWWDDFNPAFTNYANQGGDCANFVSQCLHAGGLEYEDSVWSPGTTAFIGCNSMKRYLTSIGGVFVENPSASDLDVGDIVYYYSNDNKCWGHVALVVKNNGTPYVAAHTNPQYTSNWKLGYSKVAVLKLTKSEELAASYAQISVTGAYSYDCSTTNETYDISDKYFDAGNTLRVEWFDPNAVATSYRYKIIGIATNPQPNNSNESANALWAIGDGTTETTQNYIEIPAEKLSNCLYIKIAVGCIDKTTTEKWKSFYVPISPNKPYITSHSNEETIDCSSDLNIVWSASNNATSYYVKAIQLTDVPTYNDSEKHDNWGETGTNKYEKTTSTRKLTISAEDLSPGKWIKIAVCAKNSKNSTESWSQFFYLYVNEQEPNAVEITFEKDIYEVSLFDGLGDPTPAFYVTFDNLSAEYSASWKIDNISIAKIINTYKNECMISAVSAGTTTLTVTVNVGGKLYEKSCTIVITAKDETTTKEPITNPPAEDIRINFEKSIYEVPLFDELGDPTPAFHVIFADPSVDYTASWEIENTAVAKIIYSYKNECMVSAVSAGTTILTVTVNVGGKLYTQSCTIRVTNSNGGNDEPSTQPGTQEPTKYTLTLDPNGGYVNPTQYTKTSGTVITLPTPTKSETVTFDATGGTGGPNEQNIYYGTIGWKVNKNNGVPEYKCGDSFKFGEENITLLMIWDIAAQGKLTTETPHRSGYTFLGWATTATAVSAIYHPGDNITLTRGKTLYAVWEQTEVSDKTATSCKIISVPTKTSYMYIETTQPDLTGLILEITYSDGTKENITETDSVIIKGFDTKSIGSKVVTVEYEDVSAQFTINVSYSWWQWIIRIVLFGWIWY